MQEYRYREHNGTSSGCEKKLTSNMSWKQAKRLTNMALHSSTALGGI